MGSVLQFRKIKRRIQGDGIPNYKPEPEPSRRILNLRIDSSVNTIHLKVRGDSQGKNEAHFEKKKGRWKKCGPEGTIEGTRCIQTLILDSDVEILMISAGNGNSEKPVIHSIEKIDGEWTA
ncbi:hypothetical protein JXB01_01695 [Candidatus Micrarchaeota archaeon]|nr:hypothetical protein [Candidatus Micrarchaeota archaeon]